MIEWASAGHPIAGEHESGDRCLVEEHPRGALVALIDGLGHGRMAAEAAAVAADALKGGFEQPLARLVDRCHQRLLTTRGVVMSLALIDDDAGRMTWGGLGNVDGTVFRAAGGREPLFLRPGFLGGEPVPAVERVLPLFSGDLLVMTTDGIRAGWASLVTPVKTVQQVATEILEAWSRTNDDAMVLAVRWRAASP